MHFNVHPFIVSTHFLPALINGDYTGLTDSEERQLDTFAGCALAEHTITPSGQVKPHHWATDPNEEPHFITCEVTGLKAICETIFLVVPEPR